MREGWEGENSGPFNKTNAQKEGDEEGEKGISVSSKERGTAANVNESTLYLQEKLRSYENEGEIPVPHSMQVKRRTKASSNCSHDNTETTHK